MPVNVFLPNVTRIPIAGPAPYNTLVCIKAETQCTGDIELGKMFRSSIRITTPFKLAGFDQRVPPVFDHSTTGWISSIGPSPDCTWLRAIDSIKSAGFDPLTGLYYVDIDFAFLSDETAADRCITVIPFNPETGEGMSICYFDQTIQITSYVLCTEPPVEKSDSGSMAGSGSHPFKVKLLTSVKEIVSEKLNATVLVTTKNKSKKCSC